MRICVTGGSGFIGSYFCRAFSMRGDEVVILDLTEPASGLPHTNYIRGDIRDPNAACKALEGCASMLNLAAAHHDFGIADETYFEVNEGGSKVLCEAMDECGVREACFFSTVALYGTAPYPHDETTLPQRIVEVGSNESRSPGWWRTPSECSNSWPSAISAARASSSGGWRIASPNWSSASPTRAACRGAEPGTSGCCPTRSSNAA